MNGKSKLVVPVIAIMMCAVALAGVAYAYSASVDISDNKATGKDFTLDLKDGTGAAVEAPLALNANTFVLTNATTIATAGNSVVINADALDGVAYEGKLVITTDTGANVQLTVDAPAAMNITATGATGTIVITPVITLYKTVGGVKDVQYTPGTDLGNAATTTVIFEITFTASGFNTFANEVDSATCITAVETAIAAASFALGFDATTYVTS